MKTKQDIHRPEIPDLGQAQKMWRVKVLWRDHNHPALKSGHCGKISHNIPDLTKKNKNHFRQHSTFVPQFVPILL